VADEGVETTRAHAPGYPPPPAVNAGRPARLASDLDGQSDGRVRGERGRWFQSPKASNHRSNSSGFAERYDLGWSLPLFEDGPVPRVGRPRDLAGYVLPAGALRRNDDVLRASSSATHAA
jgi:hypothetical protein